MLRKVAALLLYFILFILVNPSMGQSPIDSLETELKKFSDGQNEFVEILIRISKEYAETDPDTALVLVQRALQLAERNGLDSLKGQIFVTHSTAYSYLADYNNAAKFCFRAIEVSEQYTDTITLIDAFNNLGIDFMFQEDDDKAIEYFTKVEQLSKDFGDSLRWGHALNNLGMMAGFGGDTDQELKKYEQSAVIFKAIGEKEGYANTLLNTGTAYTILEQYQKADELYQAALQAFTEINLTSGIQNTIQSSAENLMYIGDLEGAEKRAQHALEIAIDFEFGQDEIYTYDLLSQIALRQKDFKSAFEYQTKEAEKKEAVFTSEKAQQIAELETKYRTEKKEQQLQLTSLQLVQKTREKYVLITALIVLLLIGGFIILSMKKQAALKERLLAEEMDHLRLKINSLLGNSDKMKLDLETINKSLHQPLSDREFEILNLTVSDKTNREIADQVFVSVNTVKYHLKNVYEKLGVNNRKEAIQFIIGQS